ncbi:MAG: transposase [Planctomycetia bacterium]|nr:transposase [Planctomycetia bacterium]
MAFELFDPRAEVEIREGQLPHWFQPGVTYFVTFRTADSVPQELICSWHLRRENWLRSHGIDPRSPHWKSRLSLDPKIEAAFRETFVPEFMDWLDQGLGECVFRRREFAAIVEETLRSSDGEHYYLGDFVVMPNHVHLLVGLHGATTIQDQCRSWKKYSATRINRLLKRKGRFWQEESFDHLVRSPEQFRYLQRYIGDNPKRAGLRSGEFLHFGLKSLRR